MNEGLSYEELSIVAGEGRNDINRQLQRNFEGQLSAQLWEGGGNPVNGAVSQGKSCHQCWKAASSQSTEAEIEVLVKTCICIYLVVLELLHSCTLHTL